MTCTKLFCWKCHGLVAPPLSGSSIWLILAQWLSFLEGMLLLDEKQYRSLTEGKKVLYLLQWLQKLPKVIKTAEKVTWCALFRSQHITCHWYWDFTAFSFRPSWSPSKKLWSLSFSLFSMRFWAPLLGASWGRLLWRSMELVRLLACTTPSANAVMSYEERRIQV